MRRERSRAYRRGGPGKSRVRGFTEALPDLGCSLALDDCCSGFGSLYYLRRLPFDFLKVDGDFFRQLATSSADQVTVKAVIDIARGLGMSTTCRAGTWVHLCPRPAWRPRPGSTGALRPQ